MAAPRGTALHAALAADALGADARHPLPYVANTAGWLAAESGRQPWLVYGLLRTEAGSSENVVGGNALFTLLGFTGLYALLALVFLFLVAREIAHGPGGAPLAPDAPGTPHA